MKIATKSFALTLLLLLFSLLSIAQVLQPVTWKHQVNEISDTELELVFTAVIQKDWYLYSQVEVDGPLPTYFDYLNQENYL